MIKNGAGFTLAEVLITLGIIGVVAALTMPALIQKQHYKEYSTAIKKQYSVFNQAIKMSSLKNGDVEVWDYSLSYDNFAKQYLLPYIKLSKCEKDICWKTAMAELPKGLWFEQPAFARVDDDGGESSRDYPNGVSCSSYLIIGFSKCCKDGMNCWICSDVVSEAKCSQLPTDPKVFYTLPDGAVIGLYKKDNLVIHVDVNGPKNPNKDGYDKFVMTVSNGNRVLMSGNGAKLQANNWDIDKKYLSELEME